MRQARMLVDHRDFTVRAVSCSDGRHRWSAPELSGTHGIVLVRSGRFRLRHQGGETFAEPTTAYLQDPGLEVEFAHPHGGDTCTAVTVSAELWDAVTRGAPTRLPVAVDARLELAHLLLLRAARSGDAGFAAAERLIGLLARAVARQRPGTQPGGRGAGSAVTRSAAARLAVAAAEAIAVDDPAAIGLIPLAASLGASPYHLSRSFAAHTGQTVTGYRNRVRVSRALDRLDAGEGDLARLAAELGFADQAHLTRTVKSHLGHPPGEIRKLLRQERR